ncbi:MAG: RlmE family RNA methyltransferase [Phycisphaerae bacterium]|nr:RlmE family RNA methyltransferase [Phycisphaerae bacterium]
MKEVQDHWFKLAKDEGYRSRAAYKLLEIDERKHVLRRGDRVLDAGAAPGSWAQVAADRIGLKGVVYAVDLKPIDPNGFPPNVKRLHADLRDISLDDVGGKPFDVILSDMAPNTTGDPGGDHFQSVRLCNELIDRCGTWLRRGGHLVMKVFEGQEYPVLLKRCVRLFDEAKGFKPKASRAESVEMFIVCHRYGGPRPERTPAEQSFLPKRKPSTGWKTPDTGLPTDDDNDN